MAKRVFELARELGVTSKAVLEKCRAEGLDVKNHMTTLSAGLTATIMEWFSEESAQAGSAVETTEHVDLEKAREEAKKSRRRRGKKTPEPEEVPPAPEPVEAEAEQAPMAEEPQAPQEVEAVEQPVIEEQPVAAEAPVEEAPKEEPEQPQEPQAEQAPAEEPAPVEAEEKTQPAPEKKKGKKEKKPKPIGPAGPMLVPKPAVMQGPKVIRVEQPEVIHPPRRRRPPAKQSVSTSGPMPIVPPKTVGGGDEARGKKTKRRSPRRKGGRSGDSGEKIKEWRDRDLQERKERLAAATGGIRRRRVGTSSGKKTSVPQIKTGKVEIEEPVTIKSLSAATGIKATEIIKKLMANGILATVNQIINLETAEMIMVEFDIELVVQKSMSAEEELVEHLEAREKAELVKRAPVVTFLGHVDHGKTSLLDYIRKAAVASGEAGGITQHIGAYRCKTNDVDVVFLDTPGHEAFTAMRARGANMTDVVVLVVAADDGIMPQTIEAIAHAKAAKVPIVVALNKSDLATANPNRVFGQLAEHDLQPREWGGDTEVIQTDALSGRGMDDLLETLTLEAELLELQAEEKAPASGYIVESKMVQGLGATATLLILNGTLKVGDVILAGKGYGRVRQMKDSNGKAIRVAGPATPVEVSGLSEVPQAGDKFYIVENIDNARSVAQDRHQRARSKELATGQQVTLENLFNRIEEGQLNEVTLIIKADVQGSIEALKSSLEKLTTDEVRINILHAGVGGINTGDITLAEASNAIVIGFNVVPDGMARQQAEAKGVDIRQYRVIYDIIDDITKVMEEGLSPESREEITGHAEIRQTFKVSRVGTIAGCYVTDGTIHRNNKVRVTRNGVVIEDERKLDSLKRFKDDAKEVRSGFECGLKIDGYDDIKEGDILEFYTNVEFARKL